MKKYLFGLRYGTWLTRLYIVSIPVCILAGIGLVISSFILNSMLMFLLGIGFGIGVVALLQGFTIEEDSFVVTRKAEDVPVEMEEASGEEDKKIKQEPEQKQEEPEEPQPEPPKEKPEKKKKEKKIKEKKAKKEPEKEKPEPSKPEKEEPEPPLKEPEPEPKEQKKEDKEQERKEKEKELAAYDQKKIKQVFYKYKVRKDHKVIIIDEWKEKDIKQCPAYIWLHRGQIHLLLMGKETQELTMPVVKAGTLTYVKGVVCKPKEEYPQFRKESLLSTVFSPYLPTYHNGEQDRRPMIYKNLFQLGSSLRVTNTSARTIMNLLHPAFQVDDRVTRDMKYNDFYKEIYKTGILFREQVLTVKEYQDRVSETLQKFAATGVAEQEYEKTLQALYRHKLITEEFVTYYLLYREKISTEKENKKHRRKGKR